MLASVVQLSVTGSYESVSGKTRLGLISGSLPSPPVTMM